MRRFELVFQYGGYPILIVGGDDQLDSRMTIHEVLDDMVDKVLIDNCQPDVSPSVTGEVASADVQSDSNVRPEGPAWRTPVGQHAVGLGADVRLELEQTS